MRGSEIQNFNEESYGNLLGLTRPRVIRTEEENERALEIVDGLMARRDSLTAEEEELYLLLVRLISDFEEEHYSIKATSPLEMLLHLMESANVKQKDLEKVIGSKGVISEIVNGKRAISKTQAKKLGEFFSVSPELFI